MAFTVEAIFENGILHPKEPLQLKEHEKVYLTIRTSADVQKALDAVQRSYGLLRGTGDPEAVRQVAEDDAFGILESR
jgi:predicted DNA-binding antitoxin AbrB/MazE fold protein